MADAETSSTSTTTTINYDDISQFRASTEKQPQQNKRKIRDAVGEAVTRFKWSTEMVSFLVSTLLDFKREQEDEGNDFEGDLVKLYSDVRIAMAEKFEIFGPLYVAYRSTDDMNKEEALKYKKVVATQEDMKNKGYARIKAKVKELRQTYKQAVDSGSRSGSGKPVELFVDKHWEQFREIWGGSPATTSLAEGITSFMDPTQEQHGQERVFEDDELEATQSQSQPAQSQEDIGDGEDLLFETDPGVVQQQKRYKTAATKDLANKNRNMNKKLSTQQRDMLFYQLAQREQSKKAEQMEMLRQSIDQSNKVMENMATALSDIGRGIGDGLAALAHSFNPPQAQPQAYSQHGQQSQSHIVPGNDALTQILQMNGLLDLSENSFTENSFSS